MRTNGTLRSITLVGLAALVACGSAPQRTTAQPSPTATPAATTPQTSASPPHVMIVLMENHDYSSIIGSSSAPYINSLANSNGLATNWSDVSHPSLPNYLALISGSIWNNPQDRLPSQGRYTGTTLVDELAAKGIGWKAYMEDLTISCDTSDGGSGNYDVNHDPFMYFDEIRGNASQCNRVVPYSQLASDLAANNAPPFLWVTPNLIDDMHDGSVAQGDQWLHRQLPMVFNSSWYKSGGVVIITWDEGEGSENIATIIVSANHGGTRRLRAAGNHYGTLRALEETYGVGLLGSSADPGNGDLRPLF
jgi:phosphatidylinositol-3-phosphatase